MGGILKFRLWRVVQVAASGGMESARGHQFQCRSGTTSYAGSRSAAAGSLHFHTPAPRLLRMLARNTLRFRIAPVRTFLVLVSGSQYWKASKKALEPTSPIG